MQDIILVGSGGFGREVKWLIEDCNLIEKKWNILGWVSNEKQGSIIADLPVLGDDDWLINYDKPVCVIICIGDGPVRKKLVEFYGRNVNISFPSIISKDSKFGNSVSVGIGCIITSGCIFTTDINIGDFVICNLSCTIGHDCKVESFATVCPGVNISGNVKIGECATIGTGASIIQGMSIGNNTIIGAGAVVINNIPENCTAVGVPAKILERH